MIIIIFPQMAQRSLPAVLLLLLGFVEAVDIKGNKIVTVITIFLVVFVIKLSSSLSSSPSFTLFCWWKRKPIFSQFGFLFSCAPGFLFQSAMNFFCKFLLPPSFLPFLSSDHSSQLGGMHPGFRG